jgi:hypothetical protein
MGDKPLRSATDTNNEESEIKLFRLLIHLGDSNND